MSVIRGSKRDAAPRIETLTNSGRINLNTFALTGPAVAFTNSGTIDTNGSAALGSFTSFRNSGSLD